MTIDFEKIGRYTLTGLEKAGTAAGKLALSAGKTALKASGKAVVKCAKLAADGIKKTPPEVLAIAAGVAVGAAVLPVVMAAPGKADEEQKAPFMGRNFAHRGLHSQDRKVPENSLTAFDLAAGAGYGMELDVQLSRDGQVVVFHDDDLKRVCGVDKRVDELTFSELRELRLCGTEEKIPLFVEVLATVAGRTPIIVELKTGRRNRELCEKTYEILRCYDGETCIESFDPFIVGWFRVHAKEMLRGQLSDSVKGFGDGLPKFRAWVLSHTLLNFISRPQFIAYSLDKKPLTVRLCIRMGAMNVVWTSRDVRNEKGKDAVIFEFYRPQRKFK